jgi:capsular polysaccharide biosynthesis protein
LNKLKNFYKVTDLKNEEKNIAILNREFAIKNPSQFTKASGKPRFIENINELLNSINKLNNCNLVDTSTLNSEDVINVYNKINFLIGQWGAGLTNMIWMPPKSTIVEITAKEQLYKTRWQSCYKNLAIMLGHNFISLEAQETWSGPVDVNKILELIKN